MILCEYILTKCQICIYILSIIYFIDSLDKRQFNNFYSNHSVGVYSQIYFYIKIRALIIIIIIAQLLLGKKFFNLFCILNIDLCRYQKLTF